MVRSPTGDSVHPVRIDGEPLKATLEMSGPFNEILNKDVRKIERSFTM